MGDSRFVGFRMMRLGAAVVLALACAISAGALSAAGNTPNTPAQINLPVKISSDSASLPNGTGIVGKLTTSVDTKKSKVGDRVEVEVTQDVKAGDRALLRGSHITGHVTQAYAFSKGESNAKLEMVFDKIVSKSGEQISTHLAIFALAAKHDQTRDDLRDPRGMDATAQRAGITGGLGEPGGGVLQPDMKGVYGLDELRLNPMARDEPPTSLIRSESRDVRLKKGTEIVLVVVGH